MKFLYEVWRQSLRAISFPAAEFLVPCDYQQKAHGRTNVFGFEVARADVVDMHDAPHAHGCVRASKAMGSILVQSAESCGGTSKELFLAKCEV